MASIVKLASSPTHFSQQWHYSDLEVLGIRSYQPLTAKSPPSAEREGRREEKQEETIAEVVPEPQTAQDEPATAEEIGEEATPTEEGATPTGEDAVLDGLSTEIQDMLKVRAEASCKMGPLLLAHLLQTADYYR